MTAAGTRPKCQRLPSYLVEKPTPGTQDRRQHHLLVQLTISSTMPRQNPPATSIPRVRTQLHALFMTCPSIRSAIPPLHPHSPHPADKTSCAHPGTQAIRPLARSQAHSQLRAKLWSTASGKRTDVFPFHSTRTSHPHAMLDAGETWSASSHQARTVKQGVVDRGSTHPTHVAAAARPRERSAVLRGNRHRSDDFLRQPTSGSVSKENKGSRHGPLSPTSPFLGLGIGAKPSAVWGPNTSQLLLTPRCRATRGEME